MLRWEVSPQGSPQPHSPASPTPLSLALLATLYCSVVHNLPFFCISLCLSLCLHPTSPSLPTVRL